MLESIYFGDKRYCEKLPDTKTYLELSKKFHGAIEEYRKNISEGSFEKFDGIINLAALMDGERNFKSFKDGFKLGLFIALELGKEE